ncbi:glycoside hydrolase family 2 protein [Roseiflexus sp. RS-1]|jgi:beta-mannosidase|uniref:glycoside hydrolase family 2 protein n=1 Tax=Roseiflexus sp. (strain RS-1) TaxID=357808 RepID=UPI0000D7FF40|nr:glycoside hydrolase [Roseiflexus sp. RS-1]ABQ90130.1 glycoside hydrolase family 2, sugar binding [Roseiflexus sp. RS-1]
MTNAPALLSLDGVWKLLPVDTFRQGFYPPDDDTWLAQEIPAHWQQHPLLERYAGCMVYRRRFTLPDAPAIPPDQSAPIRYFLRFNGVFYWAQPYFNGVDLGRHEGYFEPFEHEVTAWIAPENDIVVEVECPDEVNKSGKRLITGIFSHWDCMDPLANPGGIWLPVELVKTGPVRLREVLLQTEASGESLAELRFRALFDARAARDVVLRWTFAPVNFAGAVQTIEQRRALADGAHEIAGVLLLNDPRLWWTHDMGAPNLYAVTLEVLCDGVVSDARTFRFGIRTFELHDWIPYLNGTRFFVKGNNYPPTDVRIATTTRERCLVDLRLARECHMNMLRVHGHIAHPALYDAADEMGVLLWQDFPLHWLYRREILPEARRQARAMVRLLGNHPSVALWCMHNEPVYVVDTRDERLITRLRTYASMFIFSWNRDVMDSELKRVVEREDGKRPVVRSSNEFPIPGIRKGTSTHFYYGWYKIYGRLEEWEPLIRRFPQLVRFVTEFGAQSFPNVESCVRFMDADIRRIDWQHLVERHQFQADIMAHWYDWRAARSLDELVQMSQEYQIKINRHYIDRLRLRKYRPTGGIMPFMFHDANPSVSWSIIDYWRAPKRSYDAMRMAFSPQYLFTVLEKESITVGEALDLPVYIVNDDHRDDVVAITARLIGPDDATLACVERSFTLPSDCMAMEVERLRLIPPDPGTYRLELILRGSRVETLVNTYLIHVASAQKGTLYARQSSSHRS